MDINKLFSGSGELEPSPGKIENKQISLVSYLNTRPLVYGLENNLINHDFILQKDVPSVCAQRLLEGEVQLGIIPSIEYARGKGALKIIPDLSISSRGAVKSVSLYFNRDIKNIRKIALDTSSRTSVALLKILMSEKYELTPEFVVMPPDLDEMLKKADAALVIGDKALHYQPKNPMHFDLGEEWFDMTGLPFVYAFWAGNESAISAEEVQIFKQSYELGAKHIDQIAGNFAAKNEYDQDFYADYLTENISYQFGPEEKEGLQEFYRYAFYYGLIEHIPDLHFYEI